MLILMYDSCMLLILLDPQWIDAVASSEGLVWPNHTNAIEALYTTPPKKMKLMCCNGDRGR